MTRTDATHEDANMRSVTSMDLELSYYITKE